jgi:tRNA(Ile)-lysidine synthase
LKENIFNLNHTHKYAAAISGGSDSLAMLFMLMEQGYKDCLTILHFNHGLRKESAYEANWLRKLCAFHGISFVCEAWDVPDDMSNLQQEARRARYAFFKRQCDLNKFEKVLIGHSEDDVVETMLMRLGRGSGLSGLSAMQKEGDVLGVPVLRPLLLLSRETLQAYLNEKKQDYISDPSNENEKFFRIRVRNLKPHLKEAGLVYEHMSQSAHALRRSDDALNFFMEGLATQLIVCEADHVQLSLDLFLYPEDTQLRLIAKSLFELNGEQMAPRTSKRLQALSYMKESVKKFTLGGATFKLSGDVYVLEKEHSKSLPVQDKKVG